MNDDLNQLKQQAEEALRVLGAEYSSKVHDIEDYIEALEAALPKWISAKDHPPADGTWAIIYMPDGSRGLGKTAIDVSKNGGWHDWAYEVTLYFPVTKLPKGEE